MKKTLQCLTAVLLVLTLLCGCSLFAKEETTAESTADTVPETAETEVHVPEPWGEPFTAEGTQQQVAYAFLKDHFPDMWRSLFSCEVKLRITKWGIGEGSEDEMIKAYASYAVYATDPTGEDTKLLTEGNFQAGKEEYEGSVILTRYFYLQKQADGSWQCVDFGLAW